MKLLPTLLRWDVFLRRDQTRLDDLVARNAESLLCADEVAELDDLLAKVDQLTILKTRARYTLKCLEKSTTAT